MWNGRPIRGNPDSGIREIFVCEIRRILVFEVWNTAQRVRNSSKDWNPASKFHRHRIGIQFLESGILSGESKIQECLVLPYMGREWAGE